MGELRQLNEQNKLAIWAERVTECRNSGAERTGMVQRAWYL